MSIYIGVNGIARKVIAAYIGVNGVARKITNGFIGINGITRQFYELYYSLKLQHGTVSSSYATVNDYRHEYVDDHYELYLDATVTKPSSNYPAYSEIKITSDSQTLAGKTVTVEYKIDDYETGLIGSISAHNGTTYLGNVYLSSLTKSTKSYTLPSNTTSFVITNNIFKLGTNSNTLYVYSIKIDDVKIL